jgi:hypothetical protein
VGQIGRFGLRGHWARNSWKESTGRRTNLGCQATGLAGVATGQRGNGFLGQNGRSNRKALGLNFGLRGIEI